MTQKNHTAWQDVHASLNTLEAAIRNSQKSKQNDARNDAQKEQLLGQLDHTIAALEKLLEGLHGNG